MKSGTKVWRPIDEGIAARDADRPFDEDASEQIDEKEDVVSYKQVRS